jgi:hypothetical protein
MKVAELECLVKKLDIGEQEKIQLLKMSNELSQIYLELRTAHNDNSEDLC